MFNRLNWRCLLVSSFSFFSHGFFALGNRPSRWLSPWGPTCRTTGRSMTTRPFTAAPSPSTSAISYISRYHIYTVISLSSSSFFSFLPVYTQTRGIQTSSCTCLSIPPSLLAPLLSIHPHAGTIDPYYPPLASLSLSLAPCDGASSCSLIDEAPSRVPTAPYRLPLSLSGRV